MFIDATGTKNDFDIGLPEEAYQGSGVGVLSCSNASLLTINGITGKTGNIPNQNTVLWIVSRGAGQVDIANEAAGSAAEKRIITGVNGTIGTISLAPGVGKAMLAYDAVSSRWRVVYHDQGASITPTFSAANFTGSGSMTWTVAAGDVSAFNYYLRGRLLTVKFWLSTTTVGGTVSSQLSPTIPGGFKPAKDSIEPALQYVDNGATQAAGYIQLGTGSPFLLCQKLGGGNWTLSTDNTHLYGSVTFEVQ